MSFSESWLSQQRGVPGCIDAEQLTPDPKDDGGRVEGEGEGGGEEQGEVVLVPPFSVLECIDLEVANGKWRWKLSMPGKQKRDAEGKEKKHEENPEENDPPAVASKDIKTGPICFAGLQGLRAGVTGRITFDLPTLARGSGSDRLYVKDAKEVGECVLTSNADDAVDESPTFVTSGKKGSLVMVEQMLGGGGGTDHFVAYPKAVEAEDPEEDDTTQFEGGDDVTVVCDLKRVEGGRLVAFESDVDVLHFQPNHVIANVGYSCFKTSGGYVLDNQSAFLEFHQPGANPPNPEP